jgi:hypothetical protein
LFALAVGRVAWVVRLIERHAQARREREEGLKDANAQNQNVWLSAFYNHILMIIMLVKKSTYHLLGPLLQIDEEGGLTKSSHIEYWLALAKDRTRRGEQQARINPNRLSPLSLRGTFSAPRGPLDYPWPLLAALYFKRLS